MHTIENGRAKIQVTESEYRQLSDLAARLDPRLMAFDSLYHGLNWARGVQEILGLSEDQTMALLNTQTEIIVVRNGFDRINKRFLPCPESPQRHRAPLFMFIATDGNYHKFKAWAEVRGYKEDEIREMLRFAEQNAGF